DEELGDDEDHPEREPMPVKGVQVHGAILNVTERGAMLVYYNVSGGKRANPLRGQPPIRRGR
ncbi:MAG: hypothetical protein MUC46_08815, partial [Desulfobacterales bacterium]|nr:hypothetical protein [Desulfobacterales bacterium]